VRAGTPEIKAMGVDAACSRTTARRPQADPRVSRRAPVHLVSVSGYVCARPGELEPATAPKTPMAW
jgi:hypothetical protein